MDITDTLAPNSDQLDAVDLLGGPRIFTIESVSAGNAEQPIDVHLAEFPRVWRPGKSMRRVLAGVWSVQSSEWIGRRIELFCDTEVVFGGKAVGGTRISRMSHIDARKKVPLILSKGKSGVYTVDPLPDDAPVSPPSAVDKLRAEWMTADPERRKVIEAEVAALEKNDAKGGE